MDQKLKDLVSLIQESQFSENEKTTLVASLKKNGITQEFADLFAEDLSRRGEATVAITKTFDVQFAELLEQFEKENTLLEQEHSEKVSVLDPLDTAGERNLLDAYAASLKNQRNEYEKEVRDLTVAFSKATEKIS